MRPTGMSNPQDKTGGKMKSPAAPPPENTTTINVVCNGVRSPSSSSSVSSLSSLTGQGLSPDVGPVRPVSPGAKSGVFVSSVAVGRKKEPPPVSPREKHHNVSGWMRTSPASSVMSSPGASVKSSPSSSVRSSPAASVKSSPTPSIRSQSSVFINNASPSTYATSVDVGGYTSPSPVSKPGPPVFPRSNSGGSSHSLQRFTIAEDAAGDLDSVSGSYYNSSVSSMSHSNSAGSGLNNNYNANHDAETDFISSLPSLPADDLVAASLSSWSDEVSKENAQQTGNSPQSPTTTATKTTPTLNNNNNNNNTPSSAPPPPPPPPPPLPPSLTLRSQPPPLPATKPKPPPELQQRISGEFIPPPFLENGEGYHSEEDLDADGYPREKFYVNMKTEANSGAGSGSGSGSGGGSETTFAGRRDVRDPRSLHEKRIVSSKGTVRGFKNRVRAGIVTFVDPTNSKHNYREAEKGKIMMYTTSVMVVRETAERCKNCRNILQYHMVRFQQRDLHMNPEHQKELRTRLDIPPSEDTPPLPQIFVDGLHIGGAGELEKLNESGQLRKILASFPKLQVRTMCATCGGYRYVLCGSCHGSKNSVHRNNFTEEFFALRCMHCDDSGLTRCQDCTDQQE